MKNQPQRKPRATKDAERYASIIQHVKEATDRRVTVEDIQRVQRGDYLEHHPVDAAIVAALAKF